MPEDELELRMRATLETDEVKKSAKDIEESIEKVADTNEKVHEKIRSETEKTGGIWTKVFNLSNVVSLVKNGAEMIIGTVQKIGAVVMSLRDAADDQADAIDSLNLQLKNMGIYSDETSQKIQDFAEELQATTNFSNEDILGADTLLLTFRNISEDILPEATERLLDMSTVMKQDLKSSSIQLGKALSDPIEGISALSRVGITFTEQQKESIKKFMEQNDIISAQKVILNELNTEFGGHAKLMVDAVDQSKNAWQSFKEVLGERLQPTVDALFTGFSKVLGVMTEVFKKTEVEKVTEDIEEQRIKTYALSDAYLELKEKANKTTAEQEYYTEVIAELQKMYPDYLKNMDLQNIKMGEAKDLMAELNKEMETKFLNMRAEAATTELYDKLTAKIVEEKMYLNEIKKGEAKIKAFEQTDAYKQGQSLSNASLANYSMAKSYLPKVREEIVKIKAEIKETTDFYKELIKNDEQTKKKIYYKTPDGVYNNYDPSDEPTSTTKGGTGDKDKTKYTLDTSETLAQKKQKINAKADEELLLADEWQKKIIEINRKKEIAIAEAEFKLAAEIQKMKNELEKDNSKANRDRLQKRLEEITKSTQDTITGIKKTAIKDTDDVNSSKKASEEIKKNNYEESEGIYNTYQDGQYSQAVQELPGLSPDILAAEKRKEQEIWQEHYSMLEKLEEGHLSYREIARSRLAEDEKKRFEQMKASNSMQKALMDDKRKFQNLIGNTTTNLADRLISGEIKSGKQMKALMKENLKAYLIDSGQRHAHKALEEGAEAISRLAAHDYKGAAEHGLAAAEHASVAAAAGVAANGIKTSSGSGGDNKPDRNTPGSTVSEKKSKELVINTDNQQVVRLLLPELAQALDDGYSISKR